MGYEQVYKVITLYNGHRGCLNDDGTVMNDAQMAERIAALTEADIDAACVVAFNSGLRRFTLEGVMSAAGEGCIWDGRGTVTYYRSEADCRAGNRILVERMPGRGA